MKRLAVVAAGLAVLALVFWLKLLHAAQLCDEAGGRWADGDCRFEDRLSTPADASRR